MGIFESPSTRGPARLRELLAGPGPVLAPGAYDALSARLVETAGFDAAYMTGFGTTATLLGMPDVGLLTATEMVDNAARMARAIDVPLISDADTGYGNAINVVRTVQEFERAIKAAAKAGSTTERIQHLTSAVELYQGPLLPGFYEEWKGKFGAEAWGTLEKAVGSLS